MNKVTDENPSNEIVEGQKLQLQVIFVHIKMITSKSKQTAFRNKESIKCH